MKFTLSWLKEHLDTNATLEEICDKLTAIGLELEGVEDPSQKFKPFAVAYVEKAEKHPDADRLKVLTVDTGKEKMQVVCGAPNAKAGMKGVFAPEGSYIPGTDMVLKKGVIRGVESCGMMVSEREMGLSDDHEGIIDVSDKDPSLGTPFAELYGLDDPVIEIGLTPNRPDCAGVRGIARDLAAAGFGKLKPLDDGAVKGNGDKPINVHLDFGKDDQDACPLFIGRYIKGVKNGPSPEWMQKRLKAVGLRPISALVDITNYLSYDLCRPLHVFDADKIKGDLRLRLSKQGESFEGLDEKTYELEDGMTAITDDSGVINMAGIMGGLDSGCSDETTNVFLEVAYFSPERTAKTGRRLGIVSDARYRFERGIDPAFTVPAAEIATRMILELCGGEAGETVKAGDVPEWQRTIAFDPDYTKQLVGIEIDAGEQKKTLENLGFAVSGNGPFEVVPPSWRGDVEGRADLVEEIARINGYDNIEPLSMPPLHSVTMPAETDSLSRARKARTALAARGLNECVTWSFMPEDRAEQFGGNERQAAKALKLVNPISSELDQMRPSLLPNLIEAAARNHDKGFSDSALFEVGPCFKTARPDGQSLVAGGIRFGHHGPRHWTGTDANRAVDAFDVKADALDALRACGAPADNLQITKDAPDWYHPGRSGALRLGPNVFGYFGEIHPAILEEMDIDQAVCGFELFLDAIPAPKKKEGFAKKLLQLSPFQPVGRDFAFLVGDSVEAEILVRAARAADKQLVVAAEVFDVYKGKGVEDGKKSLALSVTLQPVDKTLTENELEDVAKKIIDNVTGKTGGVLRG